MDRNEASYVPYTCFNCYEVVNIPTFDNGDCIGFDCPLCGETLIDCDEEDLSGIMIDMDDDDTGDTWISALLGPPFGRE
jgi:hypothetical protein